MTSTAKEYAAALFALAKESDREAAYLEALRQVAAIFRENPAYVSVLSSPVIPKKERFAALDKAFADALPQEVLIFLHLLCQNGHMSLFTECLDEYAQLFDAAQHISVGTVTSAVPLTSAEQQELQKRLEDACGHTVNLTYTVDQALLGGITVQIDGKILDGSLRRRLREVKEVIAK